MKALFNLLGLIALSIGAAWITSSCTKNIDLKLNNAATTLVIEGIVDNTANPTTVKISDSQHISDSINFNGVTGAVVVITTNNNKVDTLRSTAAGIYQTTNIQGAPGNTYALDVWYGGTHYTAKSTMPNQVLFDTLINTFTIFSGDTTYTVTPIYQDPASERNYYRFKVFDKGVADKAIFVRDDNLNNGSLTTFPLFRTDSTLKVNDPVTVQMMDIDSAVHLYFYSLNQIAGRGGPNSVATPTNAVSNISGGCLGYFSAQTLQSKSIIIR